MRGAEYLSFRNESCGTLVSAQKAEDQVLSNLTPKPVVTVLATHSTHEVALQSLRVCWVFLKTLFGGGLGHFLVFVAFGY